jgi:DNA-binding transcriptional LysR family regulator
VRALGQLRTQFDDQLFVRSSRGMTPTPRSHEIANQVRTLLEDAGAIYERKEFNLHSVQARLNIGSTDYLEVMLARPLTKTLLHDAPNLTINFRPLVGQLPKDELERGELDIAIASYFEDLPSGFFQQKILVDPFVLVMRKGHPLAKSKSDSTLDDVLKYPFSLISTRGDLVAKFDRELAKKKRKPRHVALAVPNAMSAFWAAGDSDLLVISAMKFAHSVASTLGLVTRKLPVSIEPIQLMQVWHERTHQDPLRKWLRGKIHGITTEL